MSLDDERAMSQTITAAAITGLQAAVTTLEDVLWQPTLTLLAPVRPSHPPPGVIDTLMVLQNLLTDLRKIHLPASLRVSGGNHVLTVEELLFGVDDTGTRFPSLATKVAEFGTAGASDVVTSCHQINDTMAAITSHPSILSGDVVQDFGGWILGAVSDVGCRLANGAGPRVADDTIANLVLDVLLRDEPATPRDVTVGAVRRLHLDLAGLEVTVELGSEEKTIFVGGDGLTAAARREQRLVRQAQLE